MATKNPGVWGIDLGQCALKAVRLELVDGKVTATNFDYIEHPKILSQPDADPDQLTREALETFLGRNDLKGDKVAISVPGQSGLARFVKLPPVEEKKIGDIVRFEAKQQIPFPLEEVVWDFQKIGSGTVSDGYALETEIGLFAMKRDMVSRALQQFTDVNVQVHIIQMAPLALCNFVAYDLLRKGSRMEKAEGEEEKSAKECIVALDIGTDNSNLVITDGERIIWQRPIPIGGNHFTRALTKEMKLTFAKAEHVKRNAAKSQDLRKILLALRPVLNDFVNEVQRSLGYFTNTHRDATIAHMIGLGNAFRLPGLQKFLQEKLQLDVRKLNQLERLEGEKVVAEPQFSENILSFAVAYGLALQGLDATRLHTNLLPQEIRTERMIRAKKPWAVAAAAALLLGVGFMTLSNGYLWAIYANDQVKASQKQGQSALEDANRLKKQYEDYENQVNKAKLAVNQIGAGVEERFNWDLIYKYIDDCLPQPNPNRPKVAFVSSDSFEARNNYINEAARIAYKKWDYRHSRTAADNADLSKDREDDEFIKKNLVQINIEGVDCLYADDLTAFFDNIKAKSDPPGLFGLSKDEKDRVIEKKDLPKNGWVFAIRGYTYHDEKDSEYFIVRTFVENLRHPTKPGIDIPLSDAIKEEIAGDEEKGVMLTDKSDKDGAVKKARPKRISFVFLYKYKKDMHPTPGVLTLAKLSPLNGLLGDSAGGGKSGGGFAPPPGGAEGGNTPKGPGDKGGGAGGADKGSDRSGWSAIGEVAHGALGSTGGGGMGGDKGGPSGAGMGGGAGGGKGREDDDTPASSGSGGTAADSGDSPRTEFIILFIWQEKTTIGGQDASSAGG